MNLRNMTLYSIFVRNHGGTFRAVEQDIPRIAALGVDAVWLLPIHPIGKAQRKGTLGSPYAIQDYRKINPEYGTLEDFRHLADVVHANGMKLMIDVVYNHTSPDSWLRENHPEWFFRKPDGSFGNHVGDWSDIIDLDYNQPDLWDYQIETLKMWAEMVDGFRCDVAPMVPLKFWLRAREEVEAVRPGCIWLAETVEPGFTRSNRDMGIVSHSDAEMFQAFQVSYDYDVYGDFMDYVQGRTDLAAYVKAIEKQESIYPADYVKLRFLENHDRPRMAFLFPDRTTRLNWLAWTFFQKGMPLVYGGQEWENAHRPGLFDLDPVPMNGPAPLENMLKTLIAMKKDELFSTGRYELKALNDDVLMATWKKNGKTALGLFSLRGKPAVVHVPMEEKPYRELLSQQDLWVESGLIATDGQPMIFIFDEN